MTLTTQTDRVTYLGNGVTTAFPAPFRIFNRTDLAVTVFAAVTGTPTTLVLDVDYTLPARIDLPSGTTVTTTLPVANGATLLIQRVLVPIQTTDLTNQGKFFPEIHETKFDFLTALTQQSILGLGRALVLGVTDIDGAGAYQARGNRITDLAAGVNASDAVNVGQVEDILQNIQSGAAAITPRLWRTLAGVGQNVFQIPGATLSRSESYVVLINGLQQDPMSYVVDVDQEILVLDAAAPESANVVIRALGVVESLSSGDIDTSSVVSGVFSTDRLGTGAASDAVFLAGGPSGPTWTNFLNGPLNIDGNITTASQFIGSADASLISTGIIVPQRLGSGSYTPSTVLHGDGVYRIPAIATTTGFGVTDAASGPTVYTSLVFNGSEAAFGSSFATVELFLDSASGGGDAHIRGYITNFDEQIFGFIDGPSVLSQPFNSFGADMPQWLAAQNNGDVYVRHENQLQFKKLEPINLATTGTASNTTFLRGDFQWTAVTASLPTTTNDPLQGASSPGAGVFFRGDQQYSSVLIGALGVSNLAVTRLLAMTVTPVSGIAELSFSDNSFSSYFPILTRSIWDHADTAGSYISAADAPDRVRVNGRMFAARLRHNGATYGGYAVNASASGSPALDLNAASYFRANCSGSYSPTWTDGGTAPVSASTVRRVYLEIVPNGNTVTLPVADWPGGITPSLAVGVNVFEYTFRSGIATPLGRVLYGPSAASYSDEQAQDAVGGILTSTTTIAKNYSDSTPEISFSVINGSIGTTQITLGGVETTNLANLAVTNAKIAAGTISLDRLSATGTRDSTTALFGDNTWRAIPGGQAPIAWLDEGGTIGTSGSITSVNFTGSGVTASALGAVLTVNVTGGGGSGVTYYNGAVIGSPVGSSTTRPNLVAGTGLSFSLGPNGSDIVVTNTGGSGGGQAAITFADDGTPLGTSGTATNVNFVGAGVTASRSLNQVTVTIPGGSGGVSTSTPNTWTAENRWDSASGSNVWQRWMPTAGGGDGKSAIRIEMQTQPDQGVRSGMAWHSGVNRTGGYPNGGGFHIYDVTAENNLPIGAFDLGFTWITQSRALQWGGGGTSDTLWFVSTSPLKIFESTPDSRGMLHKWTSGAVRIGEVNYGNGWEDFGLKETRAGAGARWVAGLEFFPDYINASYGSPGGGTVNRFNVQWAIAIGAAAPGVNGITPRHHIGMLFDDNSIAPGGYCISTRGGVTSGDAPSRILRTAGNWQTGLDLSSATFTASNQPAIKLATNQRINLGGNAYIWFDGTNVKCTNGVSTVTIV